MNQFVVSVLQVIMFVGCGVVLATFLTPIPWQFPNWKKQVVVTKIAGGLVVGSVVILGLGKWIGFAL